jgi:hypothetical protein
MWVACLKISWEGDRWGLRLCSGSSLFRFVQFEDVPCSVEIDDVSVDDHLVLAGVWWNMVQIFNGVSLGSKCVNEKVYVYHMAG